MKVFLVGGAVRDMLLKQPIKDKDWVVIGSTSEIMLSKGYQKVGSDFPVFLHPKTGEEYALARTEKKSGQGYNGFITFAHPEVTLKEDLQRRDLTINAIAYDDVNHKLIDPFNGQQDIKNRVLRHVSHAFIEDPLRVLRVARFAAHFFHLNFKISHETILLMYKITKNGELQYLKPERIWKETEKALKTLNPQVYFEVLRQCNALKVLFPEIDNLYNISLNQYTSKNLANHTLMTLKNVSNISNRIDIRFATLCHNFGEKKTIIFNKFKTFNNKTTNIFIVKKFCHRLHVPNELRDLALIVIKYYEMIHAIKRQSIYSIISFFNNIDAWRKPHRISALEIICSADAKGRTLYINNTEYKQGKYIKYLFEVAKSISNKDVIRDGFNGKEIKKELMRRRTIALIQKKEKQLMKFI
ncbi:multifunctional CCA addition/repair protein [Candidatus Tachikawaea gelatinosa]|uniref:CCA-adding enzyme n=1 Tax=Candidatus Tachikawaea gelatinosa TaxID=1410383 RepID=A0A090BWG3_9ENTR|nr:multifunctional CCA addition/repair protein [Candidatus Tachikawaea gelatinosa]BAP58556.1 polynucleotide adenylyltransferase/metal dependent phosphohydrolase [Candidatus Tachikawaea gelatinosa]